MANKKLEVNVQHIIKDIEAGKFTSFQSILNETGGQHIYEAVNEELRKYLKENNAVMISATQLAHLRETGYKDFESERKALETQLKSATGDLKKQIENKLKDLKKFQYYSERKAPIGDELHKILELTDKGLVDLNDAVKAANQIMQQMQIDPHTNEKLKSLVGKTSTDTMKNFRRAIKNAQDFQKMKISAGMVGGETETARSMAFKKDGKLYVVSGSTDWTKAKEGKIGDYKTTASFSAMHNLIQSVVNATLIRVQEGTNLPITSKVAHLPINTGRMKYANTLPGVYDINVGSYQEGVKLISDLIDVLEGRKSFTDVKIPGSVQGVAEKGPFTYKNEVREAMYYNGKPIGQWVGQTVEEVKSLLDSLQPQQRQQFLGSLFGETDGKPWYNTENAKLLKEAFRSMYQPTQKDFKTYGGMSLSTLSGRFASGEITKKQLSDAIREGLKTQEDAKELASRLFYGEDKYYQSSFVKAVRESGVFGGTESPDYKRRVELEKEFADLTAKKEEIEASVRLSGTNKYTQEQSRLYSEVQKQMQDIAEKIEKVSFVTGKDIFEELGSEFLEKMEIGYLSGLSEDERPKPSKYEMYAPDVWELEEKKQQAWIESGVERMKLGYTDKPLFDDKGIKTLADRMTRLVDFYQRTTNIFSKVAEDINKDLPADTQPYTGEELARTYLARKSPEVYDRYMRSKGLYEGFTSQAQGLPLEEQIQWIRKQLDTFIAEEGNLLNTFDTFAEIADQKSKDVFSKEFARKISYVGAPGGYVAPGTLYGLLMGSTFGVAQESQMPEFDKQRRKDIYGRTLSAEAIDRLTESQVDDDISKIDFYKQKLAEMTDMLGVSSEKIGIFSDYLDKVQKVADQAGIELEQVLEGVDEQGFIKEGSLLDKQLRAINEAPVESLYLPTSGKHGISGKARESLFGLFDDTGMESLATQYDIYLDEQDAKRKDELKKQNDIRVQKEQEFTKLVDTELENRLKFLYAETAKPEYIKAQEAAERNEDSMGLSPEMFKGISGEGQKGLSIGSATEKAVEKTEKVNEANEQLAETIKEEIESKRQSIEQIKASESIQDVRKRGKIDNDYDKWTVDRVVKNELGEVTDTIYKKARKSSGSRGPSGISQVVEKVIPAVENINNNIDEINKKIPGSFKDIDWESFQKMYDKMEVSSGGGTGGGDGGGKKPPKSGGKKGNGDEEKAQEQALKEALKTEREYQQYLNQRFSLLSKIESAQAKYNISIGKERAAAAGVIQTGNIELKYLDRRNEALIESMSHNQSARKAQMDYQQELKVATMQQQKLLGTKGAKSLWDVMANDIQRAAVRITDFGIAARALNKIPQDIQKIIQYTKELDAAMTNIRIVGGYTEEQAKRLMRSYSELGNQLSATTTEIAQGMNDWLRQGYDAEEQLEALVTASTKLSKLGMISASEATTALTSALKAFNLAAEDAIKVVDKLTRVDQLAAVSAGGISTALQKSATSAKLAGMSMDELIGSVSVIGEVTQQSMDTVGNAMKSILARYGNVKAGVFTQMGLNDDGETSENINDIEKVLSKLGIKVRSSEKEMRSITDVLDDVNSKWSTFDTVTKNAIATAFGGTRMRENFLVLMENWNRVKELTEESANAAGTADEKYSAYTDSIEAGLKRVQNAWENMSQKFEGSWLIKSGIGFMEQFVSHLDTITRLLTIFAATKFADKIFTFGVNTVKGVPNIFKRLTGLGTNSAGSVTYDEKGNMVVSPQETQRDFLIRKGTQTIVDTLNKNGVDTNSILNGIKLAIERTSLGAKAQYDPKTGKIISGLNVGGKDVTYVNTNASGERVFTYTKTGRKITSKKRLDDLNRQQDLIDEYNKNLGTPANPNQISGYTGQTWWRGFTKQVKIGDTEYYRNKKGEYVSPTGVIVSPKQQKEIDELNKQLKQQQHAARVKAGVSAGAAAALSALFTTKQVGGGVSGAIGKFLTGNAGNEQTIEETLGGKALRALASGGLAAAGGAFFGPLGAMLGQTIGEGAASIVSTIVHRSELEMKQRVADAKENLSRLDAIKSTMEINNSIMTEELTSSEDFEKLYKYTDDLYDKLFELQYEGGVDIIGAINDASKTFKGVGNITSIRDLCDEINNGNADQRSMIKRQLELAEAQVNFEELRASQEETRYEAEEKISSGFKVKSGDDNFITAFAQKVLDRYGIYQKSSSGGNIFWSQITDVYGFDEQTTPEEAYDKINEAIKALRKEMPDGYKEAIKALKEFQSQIKEGVDSLKKQNKELILSSSRVGFLAADIHDLTTTELKDLTMDGVVGLVVKALETQGVEVRNAAGYIKDEYQDAIEKLIKSDSKFSALQQADTKTLGQLTSAQERFSSMLEEQAGLVKEYGKSWDKWYDAARRGKLSEEIAKIVYAANPERIEQFARAWNTTREGLEKLTKEFPDLTTAIGLMSPSEVREYYSVFTDLFEDLAANSALTAENFEKLINQYPQLLKYYKNGTLSTELLSKTNDEQKVAYANAMLSAELSNIGIGENFLTAVKSVSMGEANEEAARFVNLTKESAATILKEIGSVKSLNEVLDKANVLRQKGGEDNENAAHALEELVEQYLNYEKVIEWTDPIYAMAQQGEIDRLTQEIENLNEQKDALSSVNDERQRELNLIKAKEALENARKEKKRVYRAGLGFVMESDEEAITTAQENLDKLNVEKQQEDIQYQIEQLESLKSILENLDEEKQKEANKKALEEYFGGKNPLDLTNSDMVSKLVEGYAKNRISINTGTGEIKDTDGNVIGKIDGLKGAEKSKNEQTSSAKTALVGGKDAEGNDITGAFNTFNTAKSTFEDIDKSKIGTEEYRTAAEDYRAAKKDLETKLSEAKSAGVDAETTEKGSNLLKSYEEPEKADWILVSGLKNPDGSLLSNNVASGTHDVMLTTKETADIKQFSKSKYTAVKSYNQSTGEWGDWGKISGSISDLPDNSIVMNSDFKDAYAWVKNGQLYWLADKDGNVKKEFTWQNEWSNGALSVPEGLSLINELGTEAVITPGGTLTALPSKTGIVPADITRNVWALGEVAPTLVAQLGSLTQKTLSGNAGNTTYEEGQYFDNFTMNVYPAKGDDLSKILEQARAQMRLTRHNN